MQNCPVTCNEANRGAGIFAAAGALAEVVNSDIVYNATVPGANPQTGGGIRVDGGCGKVYNSIFWKNRDNQTPVEHQFSLGFDSNVEIGWSIVEGGIACPTSGFSRQGPVFNVDPNFVDPPAGPGAASCTGDEDFRVARPSPAIDSGCNGLVLPDVSDLDGDGHPTQPIELTPFDLDDDPRFGEDPGTIDKPDARCANASCPLVDMGAYEFPPGGDFITIPPPLNDPNGYCLGGTDNGQLCPPSACPGGSCTLLSKNRTLSFSNPNSGLTALRVTLIDLQHPIPANLPQSPPPNFTAFDLDLNGVCSGATDPTDRRTHFNEHHCHPPLCVCGTNEGLPCLLGIECAGGGVCPFSGDCLGTNSSISTDDGVCTSLGACTASGEENGCARWVGKPGTFLESQDNPGGATNRAARLQCTASYLDWFAETHYPDGSPRPIAVVGAEILPSSLYHVHVFPGSCQGNETLCPNVSCPLTITTARSGDVAANFNPPSTSDQPDVNDVTALVSKFKNLSGAPVKAIAQLQPNLPELNADINALDIVAVVDAFRQFAYAFSGPCPCPSTVTCGAFACPPTGCTKANICVGGSNNGADCTPPLPPTTCLGGVCTLSTLLGLGPGAMCVKTCGSGINAGQPCINNMHCNYCSGGTSNGQPCLPGGCPGGGFCGGGVCTVGKVGQSCSTNDFCDTAEGICNIYDNACRDANGSWCGTCPFGQQNCHCDGTCADATPATCGVKMCSDNASLCTSDAQCPTPQKCITVGGFCRDRCGRCSD